MDPLCCKIRSLPFSLIVPRRGRDQILPSGNLVQGGEERERLEQSPEGAEVEDRTRRIEGTRGRRGLRGCGETGGPEGGAEKEEEKSAKVLKDIILIWSLDGCERWICQDCSSAMQYPWNGCGPWARYSGTALPV